MKNFRNDTYKRPISGINKQSDTEGLPNVYFPLLKKDLSYLINNSRTFQTVWLMDINSGKIYDMTNNNT